MMNCELSFQESGQDPPTHTLLIAFGFCTSPALVFNFFPFFFFSPSPCYLNGFKHETRPGKGGSIVLIISNYDRSNINCIFP